MDGATIGTTTERTAMRSSLRSIGIAVVIAMVAAACGGSDDGAETSDPTDTRVLETSGATTSGDAAPTTTPAPADTAAPTEPAGGDESYAIVTIGDETYEFAPTGFLTERCDPDFFGGYWVLFTTGIVLLLEGERWEEQGVDQTPNLQITPEGTDLEYIADPETTLPGVQPGQSQIDSFQFADGSASGTATFVEANAVYAGTVEPVTGTFETYCAPEE